MSTELVKIDNGGAGGVTSLDPTAMLSSIRTILEGDQLMTSEQSFIISGAPLLPRHSLRRRNSHSDSSNSHRPISKQFQLAKPDCRSATGIFK